MKTGCFFRVKPLIKKGKPRLRFPFLIRFQMLIFSFSHTPQENMTQNMVFLIKQAV